MVARMTTRQVDRGSDALPQRRRELTMTAGWDWGSDLTIDPIAPGSALHGPLCFRIRSINAGLLAWLAGYCRDPGRPPGAHLPYLWTMDSLTDFQQRRTASGSHPTLDFDVMPSIVMSCENGVGCRVVLVILNDGVWTRCVLAEAPD